MPSSNKNYFDYMSKCKFKPILPEEINLEILSIPNNKSLSIETGAYPNKLKMAKIIPVYKSEDKTDVNNCIPHYCQILIEKSQTTNTDWSLCI